MLAEGRNLDGVDVQAVEQVRTESLAGHRLLEIAVGGRQQAHVELDGLFRPHPLDVPLLDGPQQLGLNRQGQLPDFIEEERAVVRQFELTGPVPVGAGIGAFDMAEEFAFGQGFR